MYSVKLCIITDNSYKNTWFDGKVFVCLFFCLFVCLVGWLVTMCLYLPFTATATSGNVEFIIGGTVFLVVLLAATALVLIGIVKMALLLRKLNDQIPNRSVSNNFYINTHIHPPRMHKTCSANMLIYIYDVM